MLWSNLYPYLYSLKKEYHCQKSEFPSIFNFQKKIGQKGGKVNWTEPQKVSRSDNISSKWFKSSLKYSLHVIPGTEPTFHNKTPLVLLCHEHWGWESPKKGTLYYKSDFSHVKNDVK